MNEAKQYLKKLLRIRTYLIENKVGYKNDLGTHDAMKKIANWLEHYPNATDQQVRKYIDRNIHLVEEILPGKGCKNSESLRNQLNHLRHGQGEICN